VWVHVFEEDTADGAVFRPEDADIPLSRRPRERFELRPDGSAVLMMGGADDRPVEQPARWTEEGSQIVVTAGGAVRLRIVEQSADRLIVQMPGASR
jgi:hypothetical protein